MLYTEHNLTWYNQQRNKHSCAKNSFGDVVWSDAEVRESAEAWTSGSCLRVCCVLFSVLSICMYFCVRLVSQLHVAVVLVYPCLFTAPAMQSKAWPFHDTNNKN